MRTSAATAARRAQYDQRCKAALIHLRAAREAGAKNALRFAEHLNSEGVPAPTNQGWTVYAVQRCLRRLRALGLDKGRRLAVLAPSAPSSDACDRVSSIWTVMRFSILVCMSVRGHTNCAPSGVRNTLNWIIPNVKCRAIFVSTNSISR